VTVQEAITLGLQHHQAGNFADAESVYRQILAQQPNLPDAMHLLGVLLGQRGQLQASADLIAGALRQQPQRADFYLSMGVTLAAMGRLEEAAGAYRRAIPLDAKSGRGQAGLGMVLMHQGRAEAAMDCLREAIRIEPNYPDFYSSLGNIVLGMGRADEAIGLLDLAVRMNHSRADFHNHLGSAYRRKGSLDLAITWHGHAVNLNPDFAEALSNLGEALYQKGELERAESALRRAVALRPKFPGALVNLGNTLRRMGRLPEAIEVYQTALVQQPNWAEAHTNLGNVHRDRQDWDQAIACYEAALAIQPQHAAAKMNLGQVYLMRGEFEKGWPLFEWRRKLPGVEMVANVPGRQWDGGDLKGKRILLHAEQGLGDTIQFIRYVPLVAERGGRVILACPPELIGWVGGIGGVKEKIKMGDVLPKYDVHCPLLTLPMIFKTNLETIPAKVPYLAADKALKEKWRQRLGPEDGRLKIGISWAGSAAHPDDRNRSFSLLTMAGLAKARDGKEHGARFFSLQMGEAAQQAEWPPKGMDLTDLGKEIGDFSDTAAIVDNLDLVITADTAVAHVAGALGRAVWMVLPFISDWRWMLERSDSPWYPTMRLFRQVAARQWDVPMREVAAALREM
jgi:tetratricopeptide (TPR) repeat protein